jgi:hypothetical protein
VRKLEAERVTGAKENCTSWFSCWYRKSRLNAVDSTVLPTLHSIRNTVPGHRRPCERFNK